MDLNTLHKGCKITLTVEDHVIAESECLGLFSSVLATMVEESRLADIIQEANDLDPETIKEIQEAKEEAKDMPESMKKIINDWLEENTPKDKPTKLGRTSMRPFRRDFGPKVYC